jgi:hypothetical protein
LKKIIDILAEYSNKIDKESFWKIPKNVNKFLSIPKNLNNFEQNIFLKKYLHQYFDLKTKSNLELFYWIIREWGGIKSFKINENNNKKILTFLKELEIKKISYENFKIISSLSKVASFVNPNKYAIYDSRALYSLNWLILKYYDKKYFYPMPKGRNKKINLYKIDTIIALMGYEEEYYLSYKEAYFKYCKTLSDISYEIFKDKSPFLVEMILFYIADNYIINDIKISLKVNIIK